MDPNLIAIIIIAVFLILLFAGTPIFASLGLAALLGILLLQGPAGLGAVPSIIYDRLRSFVLVAVPLFILMGEVIFYTGMGGDIYTLASRWLSRLPGGLAISSVAACAVFAAMCGVSVAGAATIGAFAIPEMLDRKYDKRLATGSVAAGGALALLIPPSIGFILYGEVADESVGMLFIGGIVPGVILALMMMTYIGIRVRLQPQLAPPTEEVITWKTRFSSLSRVWPVLLLILAVLGSIYLGVTTPTEAAAVGVVVSLLLAFFVYRSLNWQILRTILRRALLTSGMILLIFACAMLFGYVLSLLKIPALLVGFIAQAEWPTWAALIAIMGVLIVMGMFVDAVSVIAISTPLLIPIIEFLGYNTLWFGIVMVITLEMAVITPPVGLNLYVIKGIAPEGVSLVDIVRGVLPFIAVEIVCLGIFVASPTLTLWLPGTMF